MTSINYNASATTALRTLQMTNSALESTQNRISTGLKIGEAKDNAAYWSISTTLKSDNKSLSTVKDALNLGAAAIDTAYQGVNKAREVLDEIKSKLTSATGIAADRVSIQADIDNLKLQLESIATASSFSGENWLKVNSDLEGYSADKTIVSSFSRDSNNAITIGTIEVDTRNTVLFDSGAGSGILDRRVELQNGETSLTIGGFDASIATNTDAVEADLATSVTGSAGTVDSEATVNLGALSLSGMKAGDRLTFNLALNGSAPIAVSLNTNDATTGVPLDSSTFAAALEAAIGESVGTGKVDVALNSDGEITLTTVATGSDASLAVTGIAGADGDGNPLVVATATGGLSNAAAAAFGDADTAAITAQTFTTATQAAGSSFTFQFQYQSSVYEGTVSYAGAYTATGPTDVQFAALLNGAIDSATLVSGNGAASLSSTTDLAFTVVGTALNLGSIGTGRDEAVGIRSITLGATAGSSALGLTVSTTANGTSDPATYAAGTFNSTGVRDGDQITFNMTLGQPGVGTDLNQDVVISTEGFTGVTADDRANFIANGQAALDAAFGANMAVFEVDSGTNAITIKSVAEGSDYSIIISGIQGVDGDGDITSTLGLDNAVLATGDDLAAPRAASVTGTDLYVSQTFGESDTLSFTIDRNNAGPVAVTIDRAAVLAALPSSDGVVATAADMATVMNAAILGAGVSGVTVSDDNGKLKFANTATGAGSIVIDDVAFTGGADTMSVSEIDLTSTDFVALDDDQKTQVISAYIKIVNDALSAVTAEASNLGSIVKRVELQQSFVDTLIDTIDKGVSDLIDADLSEESTRLQALQTKQQLGIQALSIANSSTQNVLSLFQ